MASNDYFARPKTFMLSTMYCFRRSDDFPYVFWHGASWETTGILFPGPKKMDTFPDSLVILALRTPPGGRRPTTQSEPVMSTKVDSRASWLSRMNIWNGCCDMWNEIRCALQSFSAPRIGSGAVCGHVCTDRM